MPMIEEMSREEAVGAVAYANGARRVAPYQAPSSQPGSPSSKAWADRCNAWYRGWDRANNADIDAMLEERPDDAPCKVDSGETDAGYECPCREHWRMEQDLNYSMNIDDEQVSYAEWKEARS